ncbi:hypothetical protein STENM36S_07242 [Streptomyces tendae]
MSSASWATPFHRSPTAESLQSFSTRIGQEKRAARWPTGSASVQPGSGVDRLVRPAASTGPVTPTVTAQTSSGVIPQTRRTSSITRSTSDSRAAGGASGSTGRRSVRTRLPSRSLRTARTLCTPTSMPSTWPASARNRYRRAGRPTTLPAPGSCTSAQPSVTSACTSTSTAGRDRPARPASSVTVDGGLPRSAHTMDSWFISRIRDRSVPVVAMLGAPCEGCPARRWVTVSSPRREQPGDPPVVAQPRCGLPWFPSRRHPRRISCQRHRGLHIDEVQ